jgi:hypothetical protein|tara:strand:- start:5722 stop:5910 length:189 start_codon:yes stop_codon:yes gene_type:complete
MPESDVDINFKAPVLPLPPKEYSTMSQSNLNNILRIYFSQVDDALRKTTLKEQAEATAWFLG